MRLLTIQQFADECGVNNEMIRFHIRAGKIKASGKYPAVIDADKHPKILEFYRLKREVSKL